MPFCHVSNYFLTVIDLRFISVCSVSDYGLFQMMTNSLKSVIFPSTRAAVSLTHRQSRHVGSLSPGMLVPAALKVSVSQLFTAVALHLCHVFLHATKCTQSFYEVTCASFDSAIYHVHTLLRLPVSVRPWLEHDKTLR